jgi:hypothetical protein
MKEINITVEMKSQEIITDKIEEIKKLFVEQLDMGSLKELSNFGGFDETKLVLRFDVTILKTEEYKRLKEYERVMEEVGNFITTETKFDFSKE